MSAGTLMNTLFAIAMCGLALVLVANIILLSGRKGGVSVKEVISGGRLSREEKLERFHPTNVFWSSVLTYLGMGIFFLPIIAFGLLLYWAQ